MVLDSEDNSRPAPPPDMKEKIELYNRLQVEDPQTAQEMLAEFMSDEAVVAALSKPVEFPQEQLAWIKSTLADNADVRWTFLFLHEPAWENPSASFKEIQGQLEDRDHTFFAHSGRHPAPLISNEAGFSVPSGPRYPPPPPL